jgi:hypothetical protein
MGLRVAVANGNWSNTATWNGGVLPTVGDVVASNNFTVTIDQNINVDTLTNTAQAIVGAVPNMTSNTTPSGVVTASVNESGTYAAYKAFGGDFNTEWNGGDGDWIAYEFTTARAIDQYIFVSYSAKNSWSFEAWNGTAWVVLQSISGQNATTYTSPLIGNSTAYIKYRIVFLTGANGGGSRVHTIQFYEYLGTSPAVAGGGFILNDGLTVTCTGTNGVITGTTTCLRYSGSGVATINASILPANNNATGVSGLIYSGSGTLNLNGNILNIATSVTRGPTVLFSGTGTLNFTGTIFGLQVNTALSITNISTCNIVGDIYGGNSGIGVTISGNATVNITGNIFPVAGGSTFTAIVNITAVSAIVNMTGNVFPLNTTDSISHGINLNNNSTLNVVGNVCGTSNSSYSGINATANSYIKVIGAIQAGAARAGFFSTGTGAINILTGPFVSSSNAILPLYVTRMNYQKTLGSYYEFRDSSTNGALPPAAPAPPIRMSSPEVVSDLPSVSNVRFGVVYGVGSFTGTMRVPAAINVRLGVDVDNTVGTGAITADDVWNVLTSGLNTSGSIGDRLKNTSTVDSTGDQLAALI